MKILPVIASIISPEPLSIFVKEKYNLGEGIKCSLLRTGINHSYVVSGNDKKYVFRIYSFNWRTKQEIGEELMLLNELRQNNLGVSFPISDKNGEYIQVIHAPEGVRYAVLFSFAEGEKVRFLNEEITANIGELMAKIHCHTHHRKLNRINYNTDTLAMYPRQFLGKFFSDELAEMKYIKEAGIVLSSIFSKIHSGSARSGVIHLDIWYDNMSITKNGNITLFDFDFCGNGWLFLDIAYFCLQLYNIETNKERYELLKRSFFKGYEKIIPVLQDEKDMIPYGGLGVWIYYLGVQARRFDWSNIFLTENYLKMYIGKVKDWLEYHNIKIASN